MKINQIYVNLPVKDVQRPEHSGQRLVLPLTSSFRMRKQLCGDERRSYLYHVSERRIFQTFTNRPFAKGDTTQVLLAVGVDSREEVDWIGKNCHREWRIQIQ
jgi:predicted lactoylglutathione lyase